MSIFTLGHSTLSKDEFAAAAGLVDVIVDVRSHPGSRHVPHFNKEEMEQWLPQYGLDYVWQPLLGGWTVKHLTEWRERMAAVDVDISPYARGAFPRQRIGATRPGGGSSSLDSPERPSWTNQGLYDYAWYMSTHTFLSGANWLASHYGALSQRRAAIVCCEAVWWKCHRSMIADWLHWRGYACYHLPCKPPKRPTTRKYKPHAESIGNRLERYPAAVLDAWAMHHWAIESASLGH